MKRISATYVFLLLLGIASFTWSLYAFSAFPLSAHAVWKLVIQQNASTDIASTLIQTVRLPRSTACGIVGFGLACAGGLMQALTRNPLASPSLLGVNAGAILGIVVVTTFVTQTGSLSPFIAATIGGSIAWLLVMLLGDAFSSRYNQQRLILAGVAISALCAALTKTIVILVEEQTSSVLVWLAGSFASVDWEQCTLLLYTLLPCSAASLLLSPRLNIIQLGEERAQTLGVNLLRTRCLVGLLSLVIVGISVSVIGALAFVGIIAPHMARLLVGYDYRIMLPVSGLIGATLCIVADTLSRAIVFPSETPAGAVIALIGAPWFIFLVSRQR